MRAFERTLINRALAHTGGRRIEAATALGIGRNTITRKIQELGIDGEGRRVLRRVFRGEPPVARARGFI